MVTLATRETRTTFRRPPSPPHTRPRVPTMPTRVGLQLSASKVAVTITNQSERKHAVISDYRQAPVYSAADLVILARSEHQKLRRLAAAHGLTPEQQLVDLARDVSADVRVAVAANTHAPTWMVEALTDDEDEGVREAAVGNPHCSIEVATARGCAPQEKQTNVPRALAKRTDVSPETLAALADHPLREVAAEVAANLRTPPEVLELLAQHSSPTVALAVAANQHTPQRVLVELAHHPNQHVRLAAEHNQSTPREVAYELRLTRTALAALEDDDR